MSPSFVLLIFAVTTVCPLAAWAQNGGRYQGEAYGFVGRKNSAAGVASAGGGGEVLPFKGIALGGDLGTTIGDPDNRMTIGSLGASYHFFCCQARRKLEPFAGAGYSFLWGDINTHGRVYYSVAGDDRTGYYFNQGLIVWPFKHLGGRFEIREYRFFVSNGPLYNALPGNTHLEFRLGLVAR